MLGIVILTEKIRNNIFLISFQIKIAVVKFCPLKANMVKDIQATQEKFDLTKIDLQLTCILTLSRLILL